MNNVDKFYTWLLKCKNIYLSDNVQITKAFEKILANDQ